VYPESPLNFWSIIFLITLMSGVLGWFTSIFTNLVWWACEWWEGNPIDFGGDIAWTICIPFAWLFAIFEMILLYGR
jgi:hypothetical protein